MSPEPEPEPIALTPAEPPPEPGFRPAARRAFLAVIKENGPTIYRMSSMCEIHIKQKLTDFPEERTALIEALKRGVPDKIMGAAGGEGYDETLRALGDTLGKQAGLANAAWAVERWAEALGRPPGYVAPPPVAPVVAPPKARAADLAAFDRTVMLIVTAGGGLGGFLGCGGVRLLLHLVMTGDAKTANQQAGLLIGSVFLLAFMLVGAVFGAAATAFGWKMGRGSGKPWPTFSAALGAAFGTGTVVSFTCLFLFTPVFIAFAAFGATFTSASRGGFDR